MDDRLRELGGQIELCSKDIKSQTENLRQAPDAVRGFILTDLTRLAAELERLECERKTLREEQRERNTEAVPDTLRELLLSFPMLMERLAYPEKVGLIRELIVKILVIPNADGDEVHVFFRGANEADDAGF